MKKKVHIFIIVFLSLLVFSPGLRGRFIYDDEAFVAKNPFVKDLSQTVSYFTAKEALSSSGHGIWRPLRTLSFAGDYRLWRLDPLGYHLTNLLLHILNSCLVYLILSEFFFSPSFSFFASLFFALHPAQVETVVWISCRGDLLYAFFLLASFYLYLKKNKTWGFFLGYVLALLAKETALIFPLMVFSYDLFLEKRRPRFDKRLYLGLACISFLYLALRYAVLSEVAQRPFWGKGLFLNFLTVIRCLGGQILLALFPFRLSIVHDIAIPHSFAEPQVVISLIAVVGLLLTFLLSLRRSPLLSFFSLWFLILLLPTANIIPLRGLVSEHYLYLALVGLGVCLGKSVSSFLRKPGGVSRVGYGSAVILIALYGILSFLRTPDWRRPEIIWQKAAALYPDCFVIHGQLAALSYHHGDMASAKDHLLKAIRANPEYAGGYLNLGVILVKEGRFAEARQMYVKALRLEPFLSADVHYNLSLLYQKEGRGELSMEELRRALQDDPRLVAAHNSLGLAYKAQGRIAQALEEFLTAIRLDPDISCSYNNVASLLFDQLGRYEEAMRWFRKAIEVDPDSECGRAAKGNLERLMSLSSKGRQEKD